MQTRIKVTKAFSKPVITQFGEDTRQLCANILYEMPKHEEFDTTDLIARR